MHARGLVVALAVLGWCEIAGADGRLRVDADVRGAEVWIDGERSGKTPFATKLPAGRHRIELRKPDHRPTTAEVEIVDNKLVSVKLALEAVAKAKPPAKSPATSTLEIRSNVASEVYVDGKLVGATPVMMSVAIGKHVVELKAAGYRTARKAIDAKAGPLMLEIELSKE